MGGRMSSTSTGVLSYITNIYEYNPATNIWTQKCVPQKQKFSFGSIFFNGKIYSAGGYDNTGSLSSVEIYDPLTNTTALKNNLSSAMYGNKLSIINEQMYLINGSSLYIYNMTNDSWTNKNPA
jgi:N-acetylneuraminic acid mutarotase